MENGIPIKSKFVRGSYPRTPPMTTYSTKNFYWDYEYNWLNKKTSIRILS